MNVYAIIFILNNLIFINVYSALFKRVFFIIEYKNDGIHIHSLSKYLREIESKTEPIDFTLKSDSEVVPQETEGLSE